MDIITSTGTILNPQVTQAVHDLASTALQTLLLVVMGLLTAVINNWRHSQNSNWKQKMTSRLVAYAAQKIGDNDEKQKWVAQELHKKFPRLSEEEIEHHIEEAVVSFKTQLAATPSVPVVPPPEGGKPQ